jgi:hypothetical protein
MSGERGGIGVSLARRLALVKCGKKGEPVRAKMKAAACQEFTITGTICGLEPSTRARISQSTDLRRVLFLTTRESSGFSATYS